MITTALFLCVGAVAPDAYSPPTTPAVERGWVAKKKRRKRGRTPPPLVIETALPEIRLKIKRRRATAVLLEAGKSLKVAISGSGRLGLLVYQPLRSGEKKAKGPVTLDWSVDGNAQTSVTVIGKLDRRAKVFGPVSAVSKPKGASARLSSGDHTVSMSVPEGGYDAVVELQWYPGRSKTAAPVKIKPAPEPEPAPEPGPVAEVEPPPPPDTPLPPDTPEPVEVVAEPTGPTSDVERRIAAGEIRDGVVGTYDMINITNLTDSTSELCARTSAEKPYVFIADGPGEVTVRVYRLAPAGSTLSDSETLTILENDVLLQTFALDTQPSTTLEVAGVASLEATTPKEYKLSLGPRLSRLAFQPSEASVEGLAIAYAFEPGDKTSAMSLTMDLGDEFGLGGDLGGGTTITEVAVREKVVQVVTEKVVRVEEERKETLGVAVTAGGFLPAWGGSPAPTAGLELQWVLPFADGMWALSAEGMAQWHTLLSRGVDPTQAELRSRAVIWVVPIRVGPTFRYPFTDSIRLAIGARGSFNYIVGNSKTRGGELNDSVTAFGAFGVVSFEVRIGAGWWTLDGGYGWAQTVDIGDAVIGFNPAGFEVGTRFRFVL